MSYRGSYPTRARKPSPKPRQYRKPKTPPVPAKPSVVRFLPLNKLMDWNEPGKRLFLNGDGAYHVFPAKSHAQKAVWHSAQAAGFAGAHEDYQVEDA